MTLSSSDEHLRNAGEDLGALPSLDDLARSILRTISVALAEPGLVVPSSSFLGEVHGTQPSRRTRGLLRRLGAWVADLIDDTPVDRQAP